MLSIEELSKSVEKHDTELCELKLKLDDLVCAIDSLNDKVDALLDEKCI